ncbi:hypothetical protein TFLX_05095 [Thermoflexales bacterium]|nr:hypothetical protein TFLX_05095 [Thermoflexales bacterium]
MKAFTLPRLVTLLAFIALFAMAVRTPADTDMYWHLRTGQFILETRTIPAADPFSWTAFGAPWVDVHWLSQVILYSSYALLGMPGLALLVAVLVVLAFVFVWKQMEGGPFVRAFIVVLAAAAAGAVWTPRSQMATFVFTPLIAYLIYLYKWKQTDRLWLIPVVFGLWVNLHGGYISGFMVLGAVLAGEIANHVLGFNGPEVMNWRCWRKLLIITAISGAVLLINPYTVAALQLPFKTVNIGVLQDFIEEWAAPNFHELYQQPMVWMLLLTLVIIGWAGRRLDATDAAWLVLFAYISFLARRNIGLFALMAAPIMSRHAAALIGRYRWGQRRLSNGSPILNWLILLLIVVAASLKVLAPIVPAAQAQAEAQILPAKATDWIVANQPAGQLFNSYNWGGYLLWRLWPEYPVYADGRTDVYPNAFLQEYLQIVTGQQDAPALFDERGIRTVIIEQEAPLVIQLVKSGLWQEAYRDEKAAVLTRRD